MGSTANGNWVASLAGGFHSYGPSHAQFCALLYFPYPSVGGWDDLPITDSPWGMGGEVDLPTAMEWAKPEYPRNQVDRAERASSE
jgi:hypothetical protein